MSYRLPSNAVQFGGWKCPEPTAKPDEPPAAAEGPTSDDEDGWTPLLIAALKVTWLWCGDLASKSRARRRWGARELARYACATTFANQLSLAAA